MKDNQMKQGEREAFEINQLERGFSAKALESDGFGIYFDPDMRNDWLVWQARAKLTTSQVSEPIAYLWNDFGNLKVSQLTPHEDYAFPVYLHPPTITQQVSEPTAWLIPVLLDFTGARKVHFSRTEQGKNLTDDELKQGLEGRVIWHAETVFLNDGDSTVIDKFGVKHSPKPLYLHPPTTPQEAISPAIAEFIKELERMNQFADQVFNGQNKVWSEEYIKFLRKHYPASKPTGLD
jgi:hypothetical protein